MTFLHNIHRHMCECRIILSLYRNSCIGNFEHIHSLVMELPKPRRTIHFIRPLSITLYVNDPRQTYWQIALIVTIKKINKKISLSFKRVQSSFKLHGIKHKWRRDIRIFQHHKTNVPQPITSFYINIYTSPTEIIRRQKSFQQHTKSWFLFAYLKWS